MIRNIVFDIGNVLVDYCWRDHIAGYGYSGEMLERIGRAMMQNPVWNEMDRGVWTNEELLQGFIAADPGIEKDIRLVFSDMKTIVRERPESSAWVRSLKAQGYRTYYLSNYSYRARTEAAEQLSFLEEMDGGIMSYTVQMIKPNADIYEKLMETYGLRPEESVFLDDSPANVEAAAKLGFHTIQVYSQEQAREELNHILREING